MSRLDGLKQKAQKATQGPWRNEPSCIVTGGTVWTTEPPMAGYERSATIQKFDQHGRTFNEEDAELIAAAPPAVIVALCEVAEEARMHQCFHFSVAREEGTRWCRICERLAALDAALQDGC